ncbi:magnesium transporter MRS2-F isoform X2 [Zea mays]|uniref:Magnesium transporter n=1 Tax=Zea mays TaxID=4577 RepID=A0A804N919_MAIZE|nr:magnesium transporter MRS2-F isoform X2 [Zea mays]|eukprot:XP_008674680.1 magnesium transporter MRS2-F isoform X2 [Zea mays]
MRPHAVGTGGGGVGRRKAGAAAAAASREWMVVPASGPARVEEAGKHAVMARTGLPARDLRVLDPLLSYPSTILGRERAIVVNLERVKALITATEVLLPNTKDPAFARFVRDLQTRVLASSSDQTSTLEQEAYPALDELTSKISTLNLERVRQIKSRLVAISGRVQKVRDELEHLLDDEMDMAEMYLTEKLTQQEISEASSRAEVDDPSQTEEDRDEDYRSEPDGSNDSFIGYKPNIEELEMLLEAYFVQIDGTLNKLSHLREYVDDTEDYINIMLDDKQNQLLQMGVMLSTATVVITAGVAVVGLFGMNIGISLYADPTTEEETRAANRKFWETTFGTVAGCVILYIIAMGWGKRSGLLQ